jgi:hypothetical protein
LLKLLADEDGVTQQDLVDRAGYDASTTANMLKRLEGMVDALKKSGGTPRAPPFRWKVLRDETFISVGCAVGKVIDEPATVWASKSEGVTCEKRTRIVINDLPLPSVRQAVCDYGCSWINCQNRSLPFLHAA